MKQRDLEVKARDIVNLIFRSDRSAHPDGVSAEWLMEMHPELSQEDAEAYRSFCQAHTITYKGCYGNGEIMWPLWAEFQNSVKNL